MKVNKTITLEKAMIDLSDLTITEYLKDETLTHNLMDVLKEFNQVEGITLSIKQIESGVEVEESGAKGDT